MEVTAGIVVCVYLFLHPALVVALMNLAIQLAVIGLGFLFLFRAFTGKKGAPQKK